MPKIHQLKIKKPKINKNDLSIQQSDVRNTFLNNKIKNKKENKSNLIMTNLSSEVDQLDKSIKIRQNKFKSLDRDLQKSCDRMSDPNYQNRAKYSRLIDLNNDKMKNYKDIYETNKMSLIESFKNNIMNKLKMQTSNFSSSSCLSTDRVKNDEIIYKNEILI